MLGEIYAQGLRAAGYDVQTKLDLGDEHVALKALKSKEIDAYPEYTGTALQSFFGTRARRSAQGPAGRPTRRPRRTSRRSGWSPSRRRRSPPPTRSRSPRRPPTRLGLQKISDLSGEASELTLAGSPECRERLDCLRGLESVYGLKFGRFMEVPIPQRHEVLTSGKADVSIVFTTDPQIQRESEVLLEDDREHVRARRTRAW